MDSIRSFPFSFSSWHLSFLLGEDNSVQCHSQELPCLQLESLAIWVSLSQLIRVRENLGILSHPTHELSSLDPQWDGKSCFLSHTDFPPPLETPRGSGCAPSTPKGSAPGNGGEIGTKKGLSWWVQADSLVCPPGAPQTPAVAQNTPCPRASPVFGGSFLGGKRAMSHDEAAGDRARAPQTSPVPCAGRRQGSGGSKQHRSIPSQVRGHRALSWGRVARQELKGRRADPPPSSRPSLLGCCCDRGWGRGWPPFAARRGGKRGCECVCVCVCARVLVTQDKMR